MSTPINIAINLVLNPPENLAQVTQQFNDLANAIEKIRGVQVPTEIVSSLREAQTGATDVTRAFRGITLEEFAKKIPTLENMPPITEKAAQALAKLYIQNQLAGRSASELADKAAAAASELGVDANTARQYGTVLGQQVPYVRLLAVSNSDLIATFGGANAALRTAMSQFSQLPETVGLPTEAIGKLAQASLELQTKGESAWSRVENTISEVADSTGRSGEEIRSAFNAINDTMKESPQYASLFSKGLDEVHSQMIRTSPEYLRYRDYVRSYQAALGPLGFAFTQVGYQAYWLGIGAMFYAMSLKRQEAAASALESQMLQVASASERARDAQTALQRAIVQYGSGSEQARKAAFNYVMAQKQVELQQKQVIAAAMQQKATEIMTYATLVPLFINAATFGMKLVATVAKIGEAMFGAVPAAAAAAGAETGEAVAENEAAIQTGLHAAMVNFLKASWIPLIGIGIGVATMLATVALMHKVMADAEAEATRNAEELNGKLYQTMHHLTGSGLYDSLRLTTQALVSFKTSLEEVPRGAIDIPMKVETPEIPEVKAEKVTVPVQAQEVTVRPRVEIPRLEVPHVTTQVDVQTLPLPRIEAPKVLGTLEFQVPKIPEVEVPRVQIPVGEISEQTIQLKYKVQRPELNLPESVQIQIQYLGARAHFEVQRLEQRIEQKVIRAEIPPVQDQVQNIKQRLVPVEVPKVPNIEQTISQRLILVNIPQIRPIEQNIVQRLQEVRIPLVPSQIQNIEQRIVQTRIQAVPSISQLVIQRLVPVQIPRLDTEQVQTIRQRLLSVQIPEVRNQEQIVTQRLIPIRIPSYPDSTQVIRQQLITVRVPQVPSQIQNIQQRFQQSRIPEVRSITQDIVQRVVSARIPEVRSYEQTSKLNLVPNIGRFEVPQKILELLPRVAEITLAPRNLVVTPQVRDFQLSSQSVQVVPIVTQPRFQETPLPVTPVLTQTRFIFPRHTLSVSPILVGQPIVRPRIQTTSLEGLGLPVSLRTTRGQVFFVNIQFPNMVVRGTDDINLIAQAVEKVIVKQSTLTGMRYA